MSDETGDRHGRLCRRRLLQSAIGAVGGAAIAGAAAGNASAAMKISRAAVAYQDHPQGDKRCGKCLQFVPPDSCKLVDGPISPLGFCRIFTPMTRT